MEASESSKEYLFWIDILKGFAIFTVVVGHAMAWNFQNFEILIENGYSKDLFWWHFIYSFHMPLFFWVSGYLLPRKKLNKKSLLNIIWRRFYTLIVPYMCSGLILYWLSQGEIELWFLKSLFEILVIALLYEYLRCKYNLGLKSDIVFWCILWIILKVIYNYTEGTILNEIFSLDLILRGNYVGFVFGIFCGRYKNFEKRIDNMNFYTICFVTYVIISALSYCTEMYVISKLCRYVIPICAIVCILFFFKNKIDANMRYAKLLAYMGKHSLEIYILQDFFCFRLLDLGQYELNMVHSNYYMDVFWGHTCMLLSSSVIAFLMIMLCLLTMKVIQVSNLLSILFLGRKIKF